jgi:hypothetical protein
MCVLERPARQDVTVQAIATVEVFGDVSADVVLEEEPATWMIIHVVGHFQHQVVKNHEFLPLKHNTFGEFLHSHSLFGLSEGVWLHEFEDLVVDLEDDEEREEDDDVDDS